MNIDRQLYESIFLYYFVTFSSTFNLRLLFVSVNIQDMLKFIIMVCYYVMFQNGGFILEVAHKWLVWFVLFWSVIIKLKKCTALLNMFVMYHICKF